ncbi:calcium/sodium antiporter [Rhodococcoides corynebacterioides]|uniref:calcium/sodium antiporter n=1 Tax=Rhodococcoides corynebacterioides TaxID=53972 RepID=UPI00082CA1F1|nr:calcium/sodium antiporter [Rhodococcus corynebacterioides]
MEWALVGAGLVLLTGAGDLLVRGAVGLARRVGISALMVSLTVVSFGTAAPEVVVTVEALLDGVPQVALGNVVGSNIVNVLLVLGVPAMISVVRSAGRDLRTSYLQMVAATVVFVALCAAGTLTPISGTILLLGLAALLGHQIRTARRHRDTDASPGPSPEADGPIPGPGRIAAFLVAGLVGLPIGANLLLEGATGIARDAGLSDSVIGLTLVAAGTSLPELATTVIAALRGRADVVLGSVVGSNLVNILLIGGLTAIAGPVPVDRHLLQLDLWVMLAAALILIPVVLLGKNITRTGGVLMTGAYVAYLAVLLQ